MHTLTIHPTATKADRYQQLVPQIRAMLEGETDVIANLANMAGCSKNTVRFFGWGFTAQ